MFFQFVLIISNLKMEKKDEKNEQNNEKDGIIIDNIIIDNNKEENDEDIDKDMEIKLKKLEEIRRERRRIPKQIIKDKKYLY